MKNLINILLLVLIFSCSLKPEKSLRMKLEGKWVYEPSLLSGDTIIRGMLESFTDTTVDYTIRKLDSGIYEFRYINGELVTIQPYNVEWITEFVFDTDSTGNQLYYQMDTLKDKDENQYFNIAEHSFLIKKIGKQYELVNSFLSHSDTSMISFINQRQLEQKYGNNLRTKLEKYYEP